MVRFGQHGQLGQFAQTMYAFVFVHAIQSEDFHASEFMECEMDRLHAVRDSEYEAVDPWEDDRREAMKQLFPNNFPHEERKHLFQLRRKFGSTPIRRHPDRQQRMDGLTDPKQHLQLQQRSLTGPNNFAMQIDEADSRVFARSPVFDPGLTTAASTTASANSSTVAPATQYAQPSLQSLQAPPSSARKQTAVPLIQLTAPPSQVQVALIPEKSSQLSPTSQLAPISPQEQYQHFTQTQVPPAQAEESSADVHLVQAETFVPTHSPETPVAASDIQAASANVPQSQLLDTEPSTESSFTTTAQDSQQPVSNNVGPVIGTVTLSPAAEDPTVRTLVNSAPPAVSAVPPQSSIPSLPSLSSSQTSWPSSLSVVSSSLASLPFTALVSQPSSSVSLSSSPGPLIMAELSEPSEIAISFGQKHTVPTAKALDLDDIAETAFMDKQVVGENPEPLQSQLKLQPEEAGRDHTVVPPKKQDRGISHKKPAQFL